MCVRTAVCENCHSIPVWSQDASRSHPTEKRTDHSFSVTRTVTTDVQGLDQDLGSRVQISVLCVRLCSCGYVGECVSECGHAGHMLMPAHGGQRKTVLCPSWPDPLEAASVTRQASKPH